MPKPVALKGEAALGKHKLVVDFNGFCALETALKPKRVPDLLRDMALGLGFNDLRTWVRIFLDSDLSAEEVGELISAEGMASVSTPENDRMQSEPESTFTWLALVRLNEAVEGFFAKAKETAENPRVAA